LNEKVTAQHMYDAGYFWMCGLSDIAYQNAKSNIRLKKPNWEYSCKDKAIEAGKILEEKGEKCYDIKTQIVCDSYELLNGVEN